MPDTENQRSERRVLLIQGHPDASERHFIHALADAYAQGARRSGACPR